MKGNIKYFLITAAPGRVLDMQNSGQIPWGWHGLQVPDKRWVSPPQWNYWRLLCDLYGGVSVITVFDSDLLIAINGVHRFPWSNRIAEKQYPEDINGFEDAFRFAAKCAGYKAYLAESLGAWIAFQHSTVNNCYKNPLKLITGYYSILIERLYSTGNIKRNIGPDNQRFGAWALEIPVKEKTQLAVNEDSTSSFKNNSVKIRVTYFDSETGIISFTLGRNRYNQQVTDTKKWETKKFQVKRNNISRNKIIIIIRSYCTCWR
jgi:hypothetical protein